MNKTIFIRKAVDLGDLAYQLEKSKAKPSEYVIEKKIVLGKNEWNYLTQDFFSYKDYIEENLDLMYCEKGIFHCILITSEGQDFGILIESEGYAYARYTSLVEMNNLYMTSGVNDLVADNEKFAIGVTESLARYKLLDWGDLGKEDMDSNDKAIIDKERIVARYNLEPKAIYIITEADRSATTILFPEEY